jgi:hypothetical protein
MSGVPSAAPRVHFHTWAVVQASRDSEHGDQLDMEACSECPTWRLRIRAARGRELVEAHAVADAVIDMLNRLGAVSQ